MSDRQSHPADGTGPFKPEEVSPRRAQARPLGTVVAFGANLNASPNEQITARAVREMFAEITPRYDFLNHFLSFGFDIVWRRAAARAVRDVLARPGSLALDVCCGTGDFALTFRKYSAGNLFGTDFCHPMLVRARRKAVRGKRPVFFVEADTLALPYADRSLDLVAAAFGFRNLANYLAGLREMRRVLKVGGMVAILEFSRVHWPIFGPLFRLYFRRVLPRLGGWISGNLEAYRYLPDSVSKFPDQESLAGAMREAGFAEVRYLDFLGGVAALHLGEGT